MRATKPHFLPVVEEAAAAARSRSCWRRYAFSRARAAWRSFLEAKPRLSLVLMPRASLTLVVMARTFCCAKNSASILARSRAILEFWNDGLLEKPNVDVGTHPLPGFGRTGNRRHDVSVGSDFGVGSRSRCRSRLVRRYVFLRLVGRKAVQELPVDIVLENDTRRAGLVRSSHAHKPTVVGIRLEQLGHVRRTVGVLSLSPM